MPSTPGLFGLAALHATTDTMQPGETAIVDGVLYNRDGDADPVPVGGSGGGAGGLGVFSFTLGGIVEYDVVDGTTAGLLAVELGRVLDEDSSPMGPVITIGDPTIDPSLINDQIATVLIPVSVPGNWTGRTGSAVQGFSAPGGVVDANVYRAEVRVGVYDAEDDTTAVTVRLLAVDAGLATNPDLAFPRLFVVLA